MAVYSDMRCWIAAVALALGACDAGVTPQEPSAVVTAAPATVAPAAPLAPAPPPAPLAMPTPPPVPPPVPPAPPAPPPNPHEVVATIERTACYGWCPIYKLAVHRDGTVDYTGEEFVKTKGSAHGTISADKVAELDRAFAAAHYDKLANSYDREDATDNPSVITSHTVNGKTKRISHYHGDMHAPSELGALEEKIDEIVGTDRWIGSEKEREKLSGR